MGWAKGGREGFDLSLYWRLRRQPKVWVSRSAPRAVCFAQLIITILFYQGILQVKEHINNPFLDQKCDFPWQLFHARLVRKCVALYEAGSQPPYVVPPGSDGDVPKGMRRKPAQMPPQLPTVQISSTRMK